MPLQEADTTRVRIRAISWNLFHGRDAPPSRALFSTRSRLLRVTERNQTHLQVNRNLVREFSEVLCGAEWDLAMLQETRPRWAAPLASRCGAEAHRVLTSRNSLAPLRAAIAALNPDLIASNEGGSNLTLVRGALTEGEGPAIVERRELEIHHGAPERRAMAFTRLAAGLCVANLHATANQPMLAIEDLRRAAAAADQWAGEAPLIFGGDLNLRPESRPEIFAELRERWELAPPTAPDAIDHILSRGLRVLEPPAKWPPERREVTEDGLAIRLSDHSPVEALLEVAPFASEPRG
jgi:endonuclease/exonuclease/phosphatase family metal-dependent hydrolase